MKHLKMILGKASFHLFLFFFGWPPVTIAVESSTGFFLFFACWAFIIVILFLISRSLKLKMRTRFTRSEMKIEMVGSSAIATSILEEFVM